MTTKEFILEYFKRHKKELIIIITLSTFGAVLAAAVPYIYGKLFDMAIIPKSILNIILFLIALWFILSILSSYITNKVGIKGLILGSKISLEAESEAYGHFVTLPIPFHKRINRGEILQKISRGAWNLQTAIENFSEIFPQSIMFIFSLIIMFIIEWRLAIILIVFFILYSFISIKKMKKLLKMQNRESRAFEKQYGKVYDKLYNVYLIKNFAMEEKEKKRFLDSLVKKLLPVFSITQKEWASLSLIQDLIINISLVCVLGGAILFLRNNLISPGEFIMFFGYINMAFSPFRRIGAIYRDFKRSSVAIKRLTKLKNMVPEKMKHGDKKLPQIRGEIILKDIDFSYSRNKEILKEINLKINPGESVALVGRSGVGKTTLSELIIGYYKPRKGKIYLDGVDISRIDLEWLRNQIAIVPQDLNLFNDTLLNNLRYAKPDATLSEIKKAAKAAYIDDFIKKLPKGYKTIVGERGVRLSMGQRQRIAIAMAFLKNPKILIMDEPTSALDSESEDKIKESIKKLIKGKTTIIIAHRFSTIKNADKIVVLKNKKIIEEGNHFELMRKKGEYYKLYSLQEKIK